METGLNGPLGQPAVYHVEEAIKPIQEAAAIPRLQMVALIALEMQWKHRVVTINCVQLVQLILLYLKINLIFLFFLV